MLEGAHRIVRDHADVVGVPSPHDPDSGLARLFDRDIHGTRGDDLPHAVGPVDDREGRTLFHHPDRRPESAGAVFEEIVEKPYERDSLSLLALKIRGHHAARKNARLFRARPKPIGNGLTDPLQIARGNNGHVGLLDHG